MSQETSRFPCPIPTIRTPVAMRSARVSLRSTRASSHPTKGVGLCERLAEVPHEEALSPEPLGQ
jgi:hypothetical protein